MTDKDEQDHITENMLPSHARAERLQEELTRVKRQLATAVRRSGELITRAIEAESAKKQFMARTSYDIRPPLNAIVGFSEILAQEELTEEQCKYVDLIQSSAEQLLDLVISSLASFLGAEVEGYQAPTDGGPRPITGQAKDGETLSHLWEKHHASGKSINAGATSGIYPHHRFSGRVLVADDNQIDRMIAQKLLTLLGLDATVARNGEEVIEAVRGHNFDVIFMDMEMPIKDGYETTRELKNLGIKTPIIALTAHAMKTDRARCLAAGCDDYLAKPIDRNELLRVLTDYLGEDSGGTGVCTAWAVRNISAKTI